jgi:cell division protein FtsL
MDDLKQYQERRRQRRRQRRQQISSMQIVFASILAIGLLLAINFSARISQAQRTNDVRDQIESTIDAQRTTQAQLRQERDFAASEASVADWAHREAKMVRENEVLVVPLPGEPPTTPRPQSTPLPVATPTPDVPVWDLWWELFFDGEPPW